MNRWDDTRPSRIVLVFAAFYLRFRHALGVSEDLGGYTFLGRPEQPGRQRLTLAQSATALDHTR
jgi:hypothetical protein